jgi:hypothetical protein
VVDGAGKGGLRGTAEGGGVVSAERKETYGLTDRKGWPSGPWDLEPDRVEWRAHGLHCLMVRPHHGAWCGYVALPPGHPWREMDLDGSRYDFEGNEKPGWPDISVHGGITYGPSPCMEAIDGHSTNLVCHVPTPGEPDDVRWVGFDTRHCFDLCASDVALDVRLGLGRHAYGRVYRDLAYVAEQTECLARQAAEAMPR